MFWYPEPEVLPNCLLVQELAPVVSGVPFSLLAIALI
jgi:hypothetical protein